MTFRWESAPPLSKARAAGPTTGVGDGWGLSAVCEAALQLDCEFGVQGHRSQAAQPRGGAHRSERLQPGPGVGRVGFPRGGRGSGPSVKPPSAGGVALRCFRDLWDPSQPHPALDSHTLGQRWGREAEPGLSGGWRWSWVVCVREETPRAYLVINAR